MQAKNDLRQVAEDTLEILERGYYQSPGGKTIHLAGQQLFAKNNTKVYAPEASDLLVKNHQAASIGMTEFEVTPESTLAATCRLIDAGHEDPFVLNFASAKNPGGGFLGGAQAQEESIARSSGLYPCQLKALEYYVANRRCGTCIYTDYMIYSPCVPIFKHDDGTNTNQLYSASILTGPAVNAGVVQRQEPRRVGEMEAVMRRRIAKVLAISLAHGHRVAVLGAWGCGVFQNDPADIARYFREVIEEQFCRDFEKIVFAVYAKNERFIQPFREHFGN